MNSSEPKETMTSLQPVLVVTFLLSMLNCSYPYFLGSEHAARPVPGCAVQRGHGQAQHNGHDLEQG